MNSLYLKDNYIIRRAYKTINNDGGIEKVYFIIADGTVIFVDGTELKVNPANKMVSNLKTSIIRYGGKCSCGNIVLGRQYGSRLEWEFKCVECQYSFTCSDNRVDQIVYNALNDLDIEINFD
jgi:hypothetical protein